MSPADLTSDAVVDWGHGGGWGRRWWNEEPTWGGQKQDNCKDNKCETGNNTQNDETQP